MKIETVNLAGVVVATPEGRLDLTSYISLRDGLLELAADAPRAVVVRLGEGLEVPSTAMLSVFTTVWMKVSQWPNIPMTLLAETDEHHADLHASGIAQLVRTVEDLEEALEAVDPPPHRRVPLPCSPSAPTIARAIVREACVQWNLPKLVADAVLVVSELVENAVRHARSKSVLRIELRTGGLSLAVHDEDPAPPVLGSPDPDAPGHRGVQLVDRISAAWGFAPLSDGGKIVWAILAVREG